jgi:GT2 family glycosyltransferase
MHTKPDLSICIVNHRTPDLTFVCLKSIAQIHENLAVEVLLINNTPHSCDLGDLTHELPVTFIQNELPQSFAHNQNRLMHMAQGRYVLSLNSDTVIHVGALESMVSFMDAHPHCGLAGPKLVYPDGRLQPSCRTFPTAITSFLEASALWRLFRPSRLFSGWFDLLDPHDRVRQVDWLSGACLITRQAVLAQAGGYDEDKFAGMYGEDLEWAWRLRNLGWQSWFVPQAVITHLESKSPTSQRAIKTINGAYNFVRACYSPRQQFGVKWGTRMGYAIKWLLTPDASKRSEIGELIRQTL